MKKQILFLVMIIAVMGVVSGCQKKTLSEGKEDQSFKKENERNANQNNQEVKPDIDSQKIKLRVVEDWKIFNEKDLDFSFEYPGNWTYSRNNMGRITFLSEIGEEFIIDSPIKEALEMWPAESNYFFYKTNHSNTDLYYEHRDTDVKVSDYDLGIIKWQKGVHGENIFPGLVENNRDGSFLVTVSYNKADEDFYKVIINRYIKSFKFIK